MLSLLESRNDIGPLLMATADVSSLYTIIPHFLACEATKWGLRRHSNLPCIQRKYIVKCLDFCLKHSHFWYNHEYYQQTTGVAMGAKFAPSVAGLFMSKWEEESVFLEQHEDLVMYKRYIDDIFIIWKGDRCGLVLFFEKLNINSKNITLTWQIEEKQISFLDLEISRIKDKFATKTFFKNVDRNSYLPIRAATTKTGCLTSLKVNFLDLGATAQIPKTSGCKPI